MCVDREKIGIFLMLLRGDRTQKEVAIALNISEPAIRYYESGKRSPGDDLKIRIATYYGKEVAEIFFAFFKKIVTDENGENPEE